MDFRLTEEQRMIIDAARSVGERFGLEYWREQDESKQFPKACWQAICEAGLRGVALPEQYGGSAQGVFAMTLIIEQLAAAGAGATVGQLFISTPLFGGLSGSELGCDALN